MLFTRSCLLRLCGICGETVDKVLKFFNLLLVLLILVSCLSLTHLGIFVPEIVVTGIKSNLAVIDIANMSTYLIEEMTVMRYNNYCIFKIQKEVFKPAYSSKVKVVCRLVKKQNIGIAVKSLCKKNLYFKVRRKFCHFKIMVFVAYSKFIEHKLCVALGVPAVQIGKFSLKFARLNSVLFAKILFSIKGVLFFHYFNQSRVTHKNCTNHLILVISKVVLL